MEGGVQVGTVGPFQLHCLSLLFLFPDRSKLRGARVCLHLSPAHRERHPVGVCFVCYLVECIDFVFPDMQTLRIGIGGDFHNVMIVLHL